jgi:hypothetical protein
MSDECTCDLWHCTMEDKAAADEFNRQLWDVADAAHLVSMQVDRQGWAEAEAWNRLDGALASVYCASRTS